LIESFLFLLTAIIGFVTLLLLLRSYKSNPFCNFFLVLIIGIIFFRFFIQGSYYLGLQSVFKPVTGNKAAFYLILVPCFYLYYKYLTIQVKSYNLKDLKHVIFIILLYTINSVEILENSFIFYFGSMTNFFLILLYILFYLVLVFNLLRKKIWFRNNLLLNNEHFKLIKNWTIFFFIINVFTAAILLISLYDEFNKGFHVTGKTMPIFSLTFWLLIFFKILISPEILYGLPILNKTLLKFNDNLLEKKLVSLDLGDNWILETIAIKSNPDQKLQHNINDNIKSYIKEVDKLTAEKCIFRNPKTSQGDIAESLGVPTSHIVYLFKYHSKTSFSEYRMNSRIQDAIALINENFLSTETLESLAYKTGFASYNPFFIAFKKITNYSPQEYIKAQKNL
jgi:AraC-like DNA-binding protein